MINGLHSLARPQRFFSSALHIPPPVTQLFLKSVVCEIPGLTNKEEGELVSVREILFNLRKQGSCEQLDLDFLSSQFGNKSIAMSRDTTDLVRKYWRMNSNEIHPRVFCESQSTPNHSLYRMLRQSIEKCLKEVEKKDSGFNRGSVVAHIHIAPFLSPHMGAEVALIRKALKIGRGRSVNTLISQQGCGGLLVALDTARSILHGKPEESHILITSENDKMRHAHQMCKQIATKDNINSWLWPATFGEGVGALVVGSNDLVRENSNFFSIADLEYEVASNDSGVMHRWNTADQTTEVVVKTKEVGETYLNHIQKQAKILIEKHGGIKNLSGFCFNEPNPKLISKLKKNLNITSDEFVPTISSQVGALACVSPFSLLEIMMNRTKDGAFECKNPKIGVALVGESGCDIVAGRMSLSRQ